MTLAHDAIPRPASGPPSRFAVVVPAHDPGPRLRATLDALLLQVPAAHVLLVDDGSRDGSVAHARDLGIDVFSHSTRQGKGAALASGFTVLGRRGWPWILSMDADGQHDPSYIPRFIQAASEGNLDLVLGDRMSAPGPMPWDRRLSNALSSRLLSWRLGQRLPDSQCGFRLYRTSLLARLSLQCRQFDLESELLLKALPAGGRLGFVRVPSLYHGTSSGIHRLGDSLRFLALLAGSFGKDFTSVPQSTEDLLGSI
ncbi:MAG: glycosyltransferase family 2 protein [Candidatus Cloacimonetes bacterium]|nr:glycosyltransferase family 2 protein [Candidatus Cloacimonadota bacterium]